jgi:hypothetical protein
MGRRGLSLISFYAVVSQLPDDGQKIGGMKYVIPNKTKKSILDVALLGNYKY